jgi:hypothetical protein
VVLWAAPSQAGAERPHYSVGIKFTDLLTGELQAVLEFTRPHRVAEERRVAGIRFQLKVAGKALLEGIEVYRTPTGSRLRALLLDRMTAAPAALKRLSLREQRPLVRLLTRLLE